MTGSFRQLVRTMRRAKEKGVDLDELFGIQRARPNFIHEINAQAKQVKKAIEDAEQQRKENKSGR